MMRNNKLYAFFILSVFLSCASSSEKTNMIPFPDYNQSFILPYSFPTTQPSTDLLGALLQLQNQILELKLEIINNKIEIERLKLQNEYVPEFKDELKTL